MRIVNLVIAATAASLLLAGCARTNSPIAQSPLVIPPDYGLTPPPPGQIVAEVDPRTQGLSAIFGGSAARSEVERQFLQRAGLDRAAPGARSTGADANTVVTERGQLTQTILAVPEGSGQEASVSVPQ
jgi:hypothetical protein